MAAKIEKNPIESYFQRKIQELRAVEKRKLDDYNRLEAQRNKLNMQVRMLKEELNILQEPYSSVGEVVKVMGNGKVLVKSGPSKEVVEVDKGINPADLTPTTRVALRSGNSQVHYILPSKADPLVSLMKVEKAGSKSTYDEIGGLSRQVKEIKEVIELPVKHPELFEALGIAQPKGVILYGPPGTGKTLLARAVAHHTDATFIRVSGAELVQKYIGEGARMVRELFVMARDHSPSIIFMDEIDSIGSTRLEAGPHGDSEVQRTMLELLNQLDGFENTQSIKVIMATNRIDILDEALLRPGRIDRKIEFPAPDEAARLEILKIHSRKMNLTRGINLKLIAERTVGCSGAELKAVCTEAGMFVLRERRAHITQEDFEMAVAKMNPIVLFDGSASAVKGLESCCVPGVLLKDLRKEHLVVVELSAAEEGESERVREASLLAVLNTIQSGKYCQGMLNYKVEMVAREAEILGRAEHYNTTLLVLAPGNSQNEKRQYILSPLAEAMLIQFHAPHTVFPNPVTSLAYEFQIDKKRLQLLQQLGETSKEAAAPPHAAKRQQQPRDNSVDAARLTPDNEARELASPDADVKLARLAQLYNLIGVDAINSEAADPSTERRLLWQLCEYYRGQILLEQAILETRARSMRLLFMKATGCTFRPNAPLKYVIFCTPVVLRSREGAEKLSTNENNAQDSVDPRSAKYEFGFSQGTRAAVESVTDDFMRPGIDRLGFLVLQQCLDPNPLPEPVPVTTEEPESGKKKRAAVVSVRNRLVIKIEQSALEKAIPSLPKEFQTEVPENDTFPQVSFLSPEPHKEAPLIPPSLAQTAQNAIVKAISASKADILVVPAPEAAFRYRTSMKNKTYPTLEDMGDQLQGGTEDSVTEKTMNLFIALPRPHVLAF